MTTSGPADSSFGRALAALYAWSAGVAFVTSLGYFVFFYTAPLGRGDGPGALPFGRVLAIDTGLFALFAAHHSVMARARAKRWLTSFIPAPFERATYVWVASTLFFLLCFWWQDLPGGWYRFEGWAALPFRLAQIAGAAVALGSARTIDVFDLSGIRQLRQPAPPHDGPAPHEMGRLETGGPYRLVRHPIYLGTMLLLAATPEMTVNRLVFSVLTLIYLVIGIALEERSLRQEFGADYDKYVRKVRWRLLPGVY